MTTFAYVGAVPTTTANGLPLIPGDRVTLSDEQVDVPDNKRLIDRGDLIEVTEPSESEPADDAGDKRPKGPKK